MNANLFQRCAVLGMTAGLLFSVNSVRADDPKPKLQSSTTETHDDTSSTPVKHSHHARRTPSIDGRNSTSAKGNTVGGASGSETRVPTGSHLPATYQRKGYTSDRDPSTDIYDHNDIRFQNSNNVGDVLRQVPGVNVGGSR